MSENKKIEMLMIFGCITLVFSIIFGNLFAFLVSIANIVSYGYFRDKDLTFKYEKRNYLIALGIGNILVGKIISGVISFIIYSDYNVLSANENSEQKSTASSFNLKKKNVIIDPQVRRIDLLLKLGIIMVFIAGLIFATTSWGSLHALIKVFILLIISVLFIALSKFCEERLKIKTTTYLYWLLGMAFLVLIFFSAGSSNLFVEYFSLNGGGRDLYRAFIYVIIGLLGLITYFKFKNKYFLYLVYLTITMAVVYMGHYYKLNNEEVVLTLLPIATVLSCKKFKNDFSTINVFANIFLIILAIAYFLSAETLMIALLNVILLLINLYFHVLKNDDDTDLNYVVPLFTYLLLLPIIVLAVNDIGMGIFISTFIVTFIYIITYFINYDKMKRGAIVTADIFSLIFFALSFMGENWTPLAVSLFSEFICLITTYFDEIDDYEIEIGLHPLKIALLLIGTFYLTVSENCLIYALPLSLCLFVSALYFIKDGKLFRVYDNFTIIFAFLSLSISVFTNNVLASIMMMIGIVLYYIKTNYLESDNRQKIGYVLLLFGLLIFPIVITYQLMDVLRYYDLIAYCFSILCYVFLSFLHREDQFKMNGSLFAIAVPLFLIATSTAHSWQQDIIISVIIYYLSHLISHLFERQKRISNVVQYLGYGIAFLTVIFSDDYHVLTYVLVLMIISLWRGYNDHKSEALFRVSLGASIFTLIYQLRFFWKLIPAWLYLLIVGIVLIAFATYKQLKILDKKKSDDKR